MIKVIAFDLVGVLVREKDINLSSEEEKIEKSFGDNISDDNIIDENVTRSIFDKLYEVKNEELFYRIKSKYPNIKIAIATNHVSYVREYIENHFNADEIFISSEMSLAKPQKEYFEYILNKFNINPEELLFLDDRLVNVNGAKDLGINTIYVDNNMDLYKMIDDFLNKMI